MLRTLREWGAVLDGDAIRDARRNIVNVTYDDSDFRFRFDFRFQICCSRNSMPKTALSRDRLRAGRADGDGEAVHYEERERAVAADDWHARAL